MRLHQRISIICVLMLGFWLTKTHASEPKLAQTGFQFLSVPTQARAAALGDAFTAMYGGSMSLFYNPATLGFSQATLDFSLSQNNWIADINHVAGSFSYSPAQGRYGIFGVSIISVDYGEFQHTVVDPNVEKGFQDLGTFSPTAFAVGIAYSRALSEQFAFGIHAKYALQDLTSAPIPDADAENGVRSKSYSEGVMAFDFGTIYRTGFKSLAFGMSVRNFSQEVRFESEGFQLPLTFNIGISMDLMDFISPENEIHSFTLAVDANHPRAAPEQLMVGGEYLFMNVVALRFGYHQNVDARNYSVGAGLQFEYGDNGGRIAIDYAYTPFDFLGNVQRFSFNLSL